MAEKCLMAASLAALIFHPSSTIRCFKSKPPKSNTTSPNRRKPPSPPKPSHPLDNKEPLKSRKKIDFQASSSLSGTSSRSVTTKSFPPPPPKTNMHFNALAELVEVEPSTGIVETIFRSGWAAHDMGCTIEKVMKVNHSEQVLERFEEYRKLVKSKAEETGANRRMERVMVDGNELLRFHGAMITCSLGFDEDLRICNKKCCGVCRTASSDRLFNAGCVSFCENSWRAHEKISTECVISGVSARKAIIVCRVIAGRVAHYWRSGIVAGEEGGFDSVVAANGDQSSGSEELMVLNPSAILPCFVVMYTVS